MSGAQPLSTEAPAKGTLMEAEIQAGLCVPFKWILVLCLFLKSPPL